MHWVGSREAPKPLIVPMTTFQEIQIIELHDISWILIHEAPLLNYAILDVSGSYIIDFGAPWFIDGAWKKNSYGFP